MMLIETAITILKKNYSPPVIAGNEKFLQDDLISFFACVLEDVLTILNSGGSDTKISAKLRKLLKAVGLI
jgi:hypothetical protein